jgi:hypothetical protein
MPKKGLSKSIFSPNKHQYLAAKYYWEFKRRNSAYRKWWRQGLQETKKPEGWDARFNPDVPFKKLFEDAKVEKLYEDEKDAAECLGNAFSKSFHEYHSRIKEILPESVEYGFDDELLTIKIHFNKVRSIPSLRDHVSLIIEQAYQLNSAKRAYAMGREGRSEKEFRQFERSKKLNRNFDNILKAGDMAEKNLTGPQIARRLFPKDVDREGAKIKAHQLVKEYKGLVNGGYEKICYP